MTFLKFVGIPSANNRDVLFVVVEIHKGDGDYFIQMENSGMGADVDINRRIAIERAEN